MTRVEFECDHYTGMHDRDLRRSKLERLRLELVDEAMSVGYALQGCGEIAVIDAELAMIEQEARDNAKIFAAVALSVPLYPLRLPSTTRCWPFELELK